MPPDLLAAASGRCKVRSRYLLVFRFSGDCTMGASAECRIAYL